MKRMARLSNRRRKIQGRIQERRLERVRREIALWFEQDLGRDRMIGSIMRRYGERVRVICRNTESAYVEYLDRSPKGRRGWVTLASLKPIRDEVPEAA